MFFIDFRERGMGREKHKCDREILNSCLLYMPQPRIKTHNLGMCPDWGLNPQLFGVWDNVPTNWATRQGISQHVHVLWFFKNLHSRTFFHCFLERESKGGIETLIQERSINWLPPTCAWTGDWTCNSGMCPDRELNLQPFGVLDDAPTNWATGQGISWHVLWFF